MKYINWLLRQIEYLKFITNHPGVPIVKPLTIGKYYSQDGQDLYLSALLFEELQNANGAYIIDIGCNHPERFSNSYFFENFFDCKTIAIDPIEEYRDKWNRLRPNAEFIATALGKSHGSVILNIPVQSDIYDDMFSSITGKNKKIGNVQCTKRKVSCVTLESILKERNIVDIAIISIDVEGAELDVLEGINFEQLQIKCFIIENNTNNIYGSDDIRWFLKSKGYVFSSRIGFLDDVFIHKSVIRNRKR